MTQSVWRISDRRSNRHLLLDPLALPMFDELSVEYSTRYQDFRAVPA